MADKGEVLGVVADLLQLGLRFGVPWVQQMNILRAHGVDPVTYERVINDTRTFKDFHAPAPEGPEPDDQQ